MPNVRIQLNSAGMRELLQSAGVRADLRGRGERVLAAAQASAPVASGEYRASLHIEETTTDRAAVRVVSDSDHALEVEARTGNLSRALDSAS